MTSAITVELPVGSKIAGTSVTSSSHPINVQNTQYGLPFRIVRFGLLAMAKNGSVAPEYEDYAMNILCTHIKL